jgi:hypothetical protein
LTILDDLLFDQRKNDILFVKIISTCINLFDQKSLAPDLNYQIANYKKLFNRQIWLLHRELKDLFETAKSLVYEGFADLVMILTLDLDADDYLYGIYKSLEYERKANPVEALCTTGVGERILSVLQVQFPQEYSSLLSNTFQTNNSYDDSYVCFLDSFHNFKNHWGGRLLSSKSVALNGKYLTACKASSNGDFTSLQALFKDVNLPNPIESFAKMSKLSDKYRTLANEIGD